MKSKYRKKFIIGIIIVVLAIAYFAAPLLLNTPTAFVIIKSDSMLPVLEKGDIVLISGLDNGETGKLLNEIIAFYDPSRGKIIVHRVIGLMGNCYITKGDNAQRNDFFNPCNDYVLGRVTLKMPF